MATAAIIFETPVYGMVKVAVAVMLEFSVLVAVTVTVCEEDGAIAGAVYTPPAVTERGPDTSDQVTFEAPSGEIFLPL